MSSSCLTGGQGQHERQGQSPQISREYEWMSRGLGDRWAQRACSEVLFSLKGGREGGKRWSVRKEEKKKKISCVSVRHSFALNQRFPWRLPGGRKASGWFFLTAQTAHINKSILWGFSAPVHWRRWQWGPGLPCCRSFSDAALRSPARSTRHSPATEGYLVKEMKTAPRLRRNRCFFCPCSGQEIQPSHV